MSHPPGAVDPAHSKVKNYAPKAQEPNRAPASKWVHPTQIRNKSAIKIKNNKNIKLKIYTNLEDRPKV